jgi:mRNA interferase RelE/StbE
MELILKNKFIKQASKLPEEIQDSIRTQLIILQQSDSFQSSGLDIKRMAGQKKNTNYYRIRVGDFRIGIEYIEPSVVVITVLSRGNMYKHFPPK